MEPIYNRQKELNDKVINILESAQSPLTQEEIYKKVNPHSDDPKKTHRKNEAVYSEYEILQALRQLENDLPGKNYSIATFQPKGSYYPEAATYVLNKNYKENKDRTEILDPVPTLNIKSPRQQPSANGSSKPVIFNFGSIDTTDPLPPIGYDTLSAHGEDIIPPANSVGVIQTAFNKTNAMDVKGK